jgi:hypothetical protein
LDDGALLSAPYDPQSTLQIPGARDTNELRTEILSAPMTHGSPYPSAPQATVQAADPFNSNPQAAAAIQLPQKRGGNTRMIVGAVMVLLTAGVLVLSYIVWRGNQGASPETTKSDANVQANNNADTRKTTSNSNAGATDIVRASPTPTDSPDSQWLDGVWEGTGTQHTPKMSWSIRLTAENNTYTIEYPSLRCGGKWTLVELGDGSAKFKEVITRGLDSCSSNGDILIEKISDSQLSYKYTLPVIGEVATATLRKGGGR